MTACPIRSFNDASRLFNIRRSPEHPPACFAEQAGVFRSEGMMTKLNFKCVNAPCGSGKTTAAMHVADTITGLGQRVLIAQPSRQLVAETEKRLRDFSRRPVHHFDTDACGSGRVKAALA